MNASNGIIRHVLSASEDKFGLLQHNASQADDDTMLAVVQRDAVPLTRSIVLSTHMGRNYTATVWQKAGKVAGKGIKNKVALQEMKETGISVALWKEDHRSAGGRGSHTSRAAHARTKIARCDTLSLRVDYAGLSPFLPSLGKSTVLSSIPKHA